MRKVMALPMSALLTLAVAAPAMAGPNVSNTSGSGQAIYGSWSSEGTWGYVFLGEDSNYGGFGDIYQESGEWVLCAPSGTVPAEPTIKDTIPGDETYGFVGTRIWGYAYDLRIDFSRRLETGGASGTVELYTETVNECEGVYGGNAVAETGTIAVSVTGVGPLGTFRGNGSYQIPSEFNGHENYRGMERQATGSVVVGSSIDTSFDWAYMTQVSWMQHING